MSNSSSNLSVEQGNFLTLCPYPDHPSLWCSNKRQVCSPALSTVRQVRLQESVLSPHLSDREILLDRRRALVSQLRGNSCLNCHMSDPVTQISLSSCIWGLVLIWNQWVPVFHGVNSPVSLSFALLRNSGKVHSDRQSVKSYKKR